MHVHTEADSTSKVGTKKKTSKKSNFIRHHDQLGMFGDGNLTFYEPMFPSFRNQSVDLLSKSTDWFLYDGDIGL